MYGPLCRLIWLILAALAARAVQQEDTPPYRIEGPLTEPRLFAEGVVSTEEYESHPAFTPDGGTLYFVRSTPEFTDWSIYVTQYVGGEWSTPVVAPFSGKHRDADPFITSDGQQLYFISDRPVDGAPKEDMDIWVLDRTGDGEWGAPRNLGEPVNTTASEWFPTVATSGALYFGSSRPGGHGNTDLYRAQWRGDAFEAPTNLGAELNSAAEEFEPCVAPDESFLVFMSLGRPDSRGGGDLYLSRRTDGRWAPAQHLGPTINGPGLEISPYLSPDGHYFFFSSARGAGRPTNSERPRQPRNGLGDIYQMDLPALQTLVEGRGH
jgi:Tol biopolymer transport system component